MAETTASLFDEAAAPTPTIEPAPAGAALRELGADLPDNLYLGTSSWHFPGWEGLVWADTYPESRLSREGLTAYARHPLFRTVSLDRVFYQPLAAAQYADYAARVPTTFRFVVKAPARVADPWQRGANGRRQTPNPDFLDADTARQQLAEPAVAGLGERLGVLVFQISPLPASWLTDMPALIARLADMLAAVGETLAVLPSAVMAVEVRNPEWLTPAFVDTLAAQGATYCLGLHPRMPSIADQLPILRRLWPGPFVCRWNLNPRHGAYGYEQARRNYAPFDTIVDADSQTRAALARVIDGTIGAGQPAYVTINNKAEGSAPLSVRALAETLGAARLGKKRVT